MDLRASSGGLDRDVDKAMGSVQLKMTRAMKAIGVSTTAALAGGTAALAAMTKAGLTSVDALAKQADKLSISTESLQAYQHAARITGVDSSKLDSAFVRMNVNISDAADGIGDAKGALDKLNLSTDDLLKMSADEKYRAIADGIRSIKDPAIQTQIATDIFGRSGADMLNMLRGGSQVLDQARSDIEAVGVSISRVDAAKVEMANDAMTRLGLVSDGVKQQLAVGFAPMITTISEKLFEGGGNVTKLTDGVLRFVEIGAKGFALVGNMLQGWEIIIKTGRLAYSAYFEAVLQGAAGIGTQIETMVIKSVAAFNNLIVAANRTLGTDLNTVSLRGFGKIDERLKHLAESATEARKKVQAELKDAVSQPLATTAVDNWLTEVKQKAEQAGKVIEEATFVKTSTTDADTLKPDIKQTIRVEQEEKANAEILQSRTDLGVLLNKVGALENQKQLNAFDQFSDNMLTIAQSGNEELFAVFKAAAIANAIVKTYESATSAFAALAPIPFVGPVLGAVAAGAAIAAGLANVAAIKAQSPSFDGGGYTGDGSRSGGLDGKGGFMAMLHPRETVIDHTKNNNSSQPSIVVNQRFEAGVTRAELASVLPEMQKRTTVGILDAIQRGGTFRRKMQA